MWLLRKIGTAALVWFAAMVLVCPCAVVASKKKNSRPAKAGTASSSASAQAQAWLRSLALRDRIAQLVIVPFNGEPRHSSSREYRQLVRNVKDLHVGGLIIINRVQYGSVHHGEPYAMAAFLNRMQRTSSIPLLVGGDFERGASMRLRGTTALPHAMALAATGDLEATRFAGALTAKEARTVGVNWVFAPVADVNNNPDNPVINIRSFGESPEAVADNVRAFLAGTRSDPSYRVLATVKHFPGHGDTSVDTHMDLAVLTADRTRMDAVELVPFRAAIAANVDAVMSAHIAVPALGPPDIPATLSEPVLTGLLRKELGFNGLIVTDALNMGGITRRWGPGEAAVMAIEAGADVLLMPTDPEAAIRSVLAAVKSGRITRQRIDQSALRILQAKVRVGLDRKRLVNLEQIGDVLASEDDEERTQQIADRAVALVKNDGSVLPLSDPASAAFVLVLESRTSTRGQVLADEIKRRAPNAHVEYVYPQMSDDDLTTILHTVSSCKTVVVAAFVSSVSYNGSAGLAANISSFLDRLIASGPQVVLAAIGNPYLLRRFPKVNAYLTTFSTVEPSEIATAKVLFGEIATQGHLPVSIPELARHGDGIVLPARTK